MHMIRNGHLLIEGVDTMSFADQYYTMQEKSVRRKGLATSSALTRLFSANATEPNLASSSTTLLQVCQKHAEMRHACPNVRSRHIREY